jgi:hypothetical protein
MLDHQQRNGKTFGGYRDVVPKKDAECIMDGKRKQRINTKKNQMEKMFAEYHPI